jgi:hypothetical protein
VVVVATIGAIFCFGYATVLLVIASREHESGLIVSGRLAALRYALVGVGFLAGLFWFGYLIVALAVWGLLLPLGYALARRG